MTGRFDARAAWAALDDEQRQRIGEAALLLHVSTEAQELLCERTAPTDQEMRVDRRWGHAELVATRLLGEAVPIDADLYPEGPDLAALGVRACRECGCTDEFGCDGGCWWVEADLCSACVAPVAEAAS